MTARGRTCIDRPSAIHALVKSLVKFDQGQIGRLARRIMDVFGRFSSSNSKTVKRLAEEIKLLHDSPLVDPVWYRQSHPDLRHTPIDCARHYLEYGAVEGRNPHPLFDTKFYLKTNRMLRRPV